MLLQKTAMIVGTARDCAKALPATLARLERFRASFARTKYVIVTNDSRDDTEKVLKDWAATVPNVEIVTLDGLAKKTPKRTARLAVCRNAFLSALRADTERGEHHDFLLVADLDGINETLVDEPDFTAAIEGAPAGWTGLFANQRGLYYDVWALRHPTWCPGDCWAPVWETKKKWFGRKPAFDAAVERHVRARQIHIDPSTAPIEVSSAFGGFGIYRTEFLNDVAYVGLTAKSEEVCEHVHFNDMVRKNGGKLYILPPLLNGAEA